MPPVAPQPIQLQCPACGTAFRSGIYTLVDATEQPELKAALLGNQLNVAICPQCGTPSMIGAPLVYHDATKQLCLVHFPPELEGYLGDITSFIIRSLPADAPKAYLLNPRRFLTRESLIEALLEAEGVTKEMLAAQRSRVELISQLAELLDDEAAFNQLVAAQRDAFDATFIAALNAFIQAAPPNRDGSRELLEMLRERLGTALGQEIDDHLDDEDVAFSDAEAEAELAEAIAALRAAPDDQLEATIALWRHVIDYSFFQAWSAQIDQAEASGDAETAAALTTRRDRLLAIVEELDRQAQAMLEAGTATLRKVIASEDPLAALEAHAEEIGENFMLALSVNSAAAERAGQLELANQIASLAEPALALIESRMSPEDRLVSDLLNAETPQDATKLLRKNVRLVNAPFVALLNERAEQAEKRLDSEAAERLRRMAREAGAMLF